MKRQLRRARRIEGSITVPGDKSIAQRAVLMSLLSVGPIRIENVPDNADCRSALEAVRCFGVTAEEAEDALVLAPPRELQIESGTIVDCGNSGTTARLLAGIVAGSPCNVIISGDGSLSRRPMDRIVEPLSAMSAEVCDSDGMLPLTVYGRPLLPFEYTVPVASAQVKSAILLAAMSAGCSAVVREKTVTRDHTELMIQAIGEGLSVREVKAVLVPDPVDPRKRKFSRPEGFRKEITLQPKAKIHGGTVSLPGDISTAAYFFAAAALSGGSVTVSEVGLNPTRTGIIEYLKAVGATVRITDRSTVSGELRGTVTVTGGELKPRRVEGETTAGLIDEIPIVAVIAALTTGTTVIRDAEELRHKESNRLEAIAANLTRMGVKCGLLEDGLAIEGKGDLAGADLASFGDHRIAMAFSIAALFGEGPSNLDDDSAAGISCPTFYEILDRIAS